MILVDNKNTFKKYQTISSILLGYGETTMISLPHVRFDMPEKLQIPFKIITSKTCKKNNTKLQLLEVTSSVFGKARYRRP